MKLSEALDRQVYLFKHECRKCPYRIDYKIADECKECPVQKEMLEIGAFISQNTINKRNRGKERGSNQKWNSIKYEKGI